MSRGSCRTLLFQALLVRSAYQKYYIFLKMPILIRFFLLALQVSVFVMAQEEGFSPLGESAMPSFQPTQFCGLNELPDTNTQSIDTASQSCEEVSSPARLPTTLGPAEVNDDEVQFVFSVPRRRKKKRKRYDEPSLCHIMIQALIDMLGRILRTIRLV